MAVAAVATGDLVRSLSREESLLVARSVSLVARSLSRGVSRCEESLIERGEEEDG